MDFKISQTTNCTYIHCMYIPIYIVTMFIGMWTWNMNLEVHECALECKFGMWLWVWLWNVTMYMTVCMCRAHQVQRESKAPVVPMVHGWVYLTLVCHWRTNCDPTCPLPVDRVIKGQKDRVELLDPRADRDLLEGVAHLGSWDREDPRYVESREVRLSGNWIVFVDCVQGAIGPNGEQGPRGRNGDAVSAVIDRVKFDKLF